MKHAWIFLPLVLAACSGGMRQETVTDPKVAEPLLLKAAMATEQAQQTLAAHLQEALAEGGATHAVGFCSSRALPLTKSVADSYNMRLKRTSLKVRNPENAPDAAEREQLELWAKDFNGTPPEARLVSLNNGSYRVYRPIMVKPLCVTCHGPNLASDLKDELKRRYPSDQATGYEAGDLRGMWTAEFVMKDEQLR